MSIAPEIAKDAPTYTVKILLLGQSSVGKSSLVNRYTNHTFQNNGLLTIGIQVKKIMKQMNGKRIRLELWDTAGQEKYRTLPSQYYRGIQGILLVYDISNLESFERIEEWFNKIEENCKVEQLVINLAGNKLDLENRREVNTDNARLFAQKYKMGFGEVSAKTCSNVQETIEGMMQKIVKKGLVEPKQQKMKLDNPNQCGRKNENDSCC